jgi:uncharacterized membrane protein YeiH
MFIHVPHGKHQCLLQIFLCHWVAQPLTNPYEVFWTDTVGLAAFAVLGARVAACLPDHHVHAGGWSGS